MRVGQIRDLQGVMCEDDQYVKRHTRKLKMRVERDVVASVDDNEMKFSFFRMANPESFIISSVDVPRGTFESLKYKAVGWPKSKGTIILYDSDEDLNFFPLGESSGCAWIPPSHFVDIRRYTSIRQLIVDNGTSTTIWRVSATRGGRVRWIGWNRDDFGQYEVVDAEDQARIFMTKRDAEQAEIRQHTQALGTAYDYAAL